MSKSGDVPLGIITKFSPTYEERKRRYDLQETIQGLVDKDKFNRVRWCSRRMVAKVGIHRSLEHRACFYSGLLICGSVWACPVCSAKIQSRRAHEVSEVCYYAYHNGRKAVMITFTHPHNKGQKLTDNMRMHNEALKLFRKGRAFDLFKTRAGYEGVIRGNEVTYGKNGWHYHDHELWLVDKSFDISKEVEWLKERWLRCCKKAGFVINDEVAFMEHSVDVMDNCHATDYLQKMGESWGADKELAKGSSKTRGKNPFDLVSTEPARFLEYINATKGKVQLFFSKGLKQAAGLQEKTDEELATEQVDKAEVLAWLDRVAWEIVLQEKARAELTEIGLQRGFEGIAEWFSKYSIEIERGNV